MYFLFTNDSSFIQHEVIHNLQQLKLAEACDWKYIHSALPSPVSPFFTRPFYCSLCFFTQHSTPHISLYQITTNDKEPKSSNKEEITADPIG